MNCKKCAELISEHMDNCLAGRLAEQFDAHISHCRKCAGELRAMEGMIRSLGDLAVQRAPRDCWSGVRERIIAGEAQTSARALTILRPAFAVPVCAVLILVAVMLFRPTPVHEPAPPALVSVPEYSRYISAHSSLQRQQTLTDPHVTFIAAELEKASLTHGRDSQ